MTETNQVSRGEEEVGRMIGQRTLSTLKRSERTLDGDDQSSSSSDSPALKLATSSSLRFPFRALFPAFLSAFFRVFLELPPGKTA